MDIAVIGLGYVGSVSTGCLADLGHRIIGLDVDLEKVSKLARGHSPILEPGLEDKVASGHAKARITATSNMLRAVAHSDMAMLAVGTPSTEEGGIDDSFLVESIRSLGAAIRATGKTRYVVMSRSTSPPPVHQKLMAMLAETSGLSYDDGLGYVCHPEFLREGVAITDFQAPPKIVFGIHGKICREFCNQLYPSITAPTSFVSVNTAAMVKYADNCFHAVKVTFANEMGMICQSLGVDSSEVMELFCTDSKLNISSKYLRPGGPFGGSCLPKDLRSMLHIANTTSTPLKMLAGAYASNITQVDALLQRILESAPKVVGIVGLSFKEGTPDLRESPTVQLLERLRKSGVDVIAYDEELAAVDSNCLEDLQGHLYADLNRVVQEADVLVVYHGLSQLQWEQVDFKDALVLDVSNVPMLRQSEHYQGLYWDNSKEDFMTSAPTPNHAICSLTPHQDGQD